MKMGQGWQINSCLAEYSYAIKWHQSTTKSRAYFDPPPPLDYVIYTRQNLSTNCTDQFSQWPHYFFSVIKESGDEETAASFLFSPQPASLQTHLQTGKAQLAPPLPTLCCSGILPVLTTNFNYKLQQTLQTLRLNGYLRKSCQVSDSPHNK